VPRRPRAQVRPLRKRTVSRSTHDRRQPVDDAEIAPESLAGEEIAEVPAAVPYIRRRSIAETPPRASAVGPSLAPRSTRGLITDYGYVVSELQRTALTFGGLIVLLIVISRLLR
jgi:hypothetical protein